jgi:hypothetical protein
MDYRQVALYYYMRVDHSSDDKRLSLQYLGDADNLSTIQRMP